MNITFIDTITSGRGDIYIILFSLFISAVLFRKHMPIYVTIVLGLCLIFREEIRDFTLTKHDTKKQVKKQQTNIKKHINQTSLSRQMLKDLKRYKRYSPRAYRQGERYLMMFFNEMQGFNNSTHKKHSLDNAELYSQQSLKLFRSIMFSIPETMYGSKSTKDLQQKLALVCESLENHLYKIIHNRVQINNLDFKENPDIYKCEKIYDTDNVKQSNYYHENELS